MREAENCAARERRTAALLAALFLAACGARTALPNGGATFVDAGPLDDADSSHDATRDDAAPTCDLDDLSTWTVERHRDFGDYERFAVATSGVPWVALKVKGGNVVIEKLGVDDQSGIAVLDSFEIPDSPVYPVALDVSDTHFAVLTTTGLNWNGDIELWSIDRASQSVVHAPIGAPPANPAYTIGSAVGFVGDEIAVAYARLANAEGTLELRGTDLQLVSSQTVNGSSFDAVHRSDGALDVYVGATVRLHIDGGAVSQESVDPAWPELGGLDDFLVQYGNTIQQFRLVSGAQIWSGPWPDTQISAPAVVRTHAGRAVFSIEGDLTGVVGYTHAGALDWMKIESSSDASGIGDAVMPVIEDGRVGLFYLGLEIPKPEQPLRYFGRRCP